jgi:hypothetical protein
MVQAFEETQNNILIKFLEVEDEKKLHDSKFKAIKTKLQNSKNFAKKYEHKININNLKNKLDSQSYGISFRNY